jgi:hypothetical protein
MPISVSAGIRVGPLMSTKERTVPENPDKPCVRIFGHLLSAPPRVGCGPLMSALSRIAAGGMLLCAFVSAAACNAVLGIEQAELDIVSCEAGQGYTLGTCQTSQSCESCLTRACSPQERSGCLADSSCRMALADYRRCGSDDCRDPSGNCRDCLLGGVGAECFADCTEECQRSELMDLCELLCSCMEDMCPGNASACRNDCAAANAPWRASCLLTHCELAANADSVHCLHASDGVEACPRMPPTIDPNCMDRGQVGYGCTDRGDCCTDFCKDGVCSL